jgi:hypothetical protein
LKALSLLEAADRKAFLNDLKASAGRPRSVSPGMGTGGKDLDAKAFAKAVRTGRF